MTAKRLMTEGLVALIAAAPAAFGDAVIFSAAGTDAQVTAELNRFRTALGPLNPNTPQSFGSGRREINWDSLPDNVCAPSFFPADFFNVPATGQARGVRFRVIGDGLQVSADSDNPSGVAPNFANLNLQYGQLFRPFSAERLFTVVNGLCAVDFFVPGSGLPATVSGFGIVFSDVDLATSAELFFINERDELITTVFAPPATTTNGGASFVGILFDAGERVARVGILNGNAPIGGADLEGPTGSGGFIDLVVMDDMVYGEPIAQATCPGDVNGNGAIGTEDLALLLSSFGACTGDPEFIEAADLSGDACVDLADLATLLASFGGTCR